MELLSRSQLLECLEQRQREHVGRTAMKNPREREGLKAIAAD
jgi:hypothetical protein